ncbi:hypothetical protein ES707_07787 [subsurface metagenome]
MTSRTGRSPNSKTLCSISASASSTVPSLCPTDIMVRISSGLASDLKTGFPPTNLVNPKAIQLSATTKGVSSQDSHSIGRASISDSLSACWVAMVLGVVSENIRRRMVTATVAMRTPFSPQRETATTVPRAAAATLEKLAPSRMVERSFSGRSIILATRLAPLTLFSSRCSILILCRAMKDVSEAEKKADSSRQMTKRTMYSSILDIQYHPTRITSLK